MKNAATKAMTAASSAMGNKDIEKLVPAVIEALAAPAKVPDTIHKLGATTFVAAVTGTPPKLYIHAHSVCLHHTHVPSFNFDPQSS